VAFSIVLGETAARRSQCPATPTKPKSAPWWRTGPRICIGAFGNQCGAWGSARHRRVGQPRDRPLSGPDCFPARGPAACGCADRSRHAGRRSDGSRAIAHTDRGSVVENCSRGFRRGSSHRCRGVRCPGRSGCHHDGHVAARCRRGSIKRGGRPGHAALSRFVRRRGRRSRPRLDGRYSECGQSRGQPRSLSTERLFFSASYSTSSPGNVALNASMMSCGVWP
jgi:hypothetical protein